MTLIGGANNGIIGFDSYAIAITLPIAITLTTDHNLKIGFINSRYCELLITDQWMAEYHLFKHLRID